jgi:ribosomal protein L39E
MGSRKTKGKKKRLIKKGRYSDAPIWASIRKYGMKRSRRRRIRVNKEKHWRD